MGYDKIGISMFGQVRTWMVVWMILMTWMDKLESLA